jgi:hypothetical protein
MNELKEIEFTFKVKVATYNNITEFSTMDIKDAYMNTTLELIKDKGLVAYGQFTITSE